MPDYLTDDITDFARLHGEVGMLREDARRAAERAIRFHHPAAEEAFDTAYRALADAAAECATALARLREAQSRIEEDDVSRERRAARDAA